MQGKCAIPVEILGVLSQNGHVNEALVLAKLTIHKLDEPTSERYYEQIRPVLKEVDGFLGVGLWRSAESGGKHVAIYRYRDFASADAGLEAVSDHRSLTSAQSVLTTPADVHRCRYLCASGQPLTDAPIGTYLSLSVRTAEPGYGTDLAAEVERIFEELELIDGYLGSYIGMNDTLEEEVLGMVTWTQEHAFRSSVPMRPPYDVQLFRRVI